MINQTRLPWTCLACGHKQTKKTLAPSLCNVCGTTEGEDEDGNTAADYGRDERNAKNR